MPKTLKLLPFLALLLLTKNSNAQSSRNLSKLDTLLEKANNLGVFNGNLLVAEKGKIIYKKTIGWADASGNIKLTEDYRFHIGSVAKEFNAVGILMLKEQGKLSLDDKVSKYLPELPSWADKISIRNLLQYTSGIPQSKWKETKGDANNMENLKLVKTLIFEPGTKYDYNNNDVFLQKRIIEKITGMSYKDFVMNKIFKPCGIKNAIVDPVETDKLIAKAFNNQKIQDNFKYEIGGWPALTLNDFYKWSESINSFRLITPASTRELTIPFSTDDQTGLGYGTLAGNVLTSHRHDGTAMNYQALLISEPASSGTIILMTNNKQDNLDAISKSVLSVLAGKDYQQIKRSFVNDYKDQLKNMDGQGIVAIYEKIKAESPDRYSFDSDNMMNEVGYFLLNNTKTDDAITVFTYNTKLFPVLGNVFDSLGEAYYTKGDKVKALENYTIALKLDPTLDSAEKMIKELK